MIEAAGIRRTEFPECHEVFNSFQEGILIPYRNYQGGEEFRESGRHFRIKYDAEYRGNDRFSNSLRNQTYLPPNIHSCLGQEICFIVGSEEEALALACEGYLAVGCPGSQVEGETVPCDGYQNSEGFTDEFCSLLEEAKPKSVRFVGDQDALFNAQFSNSVARLANCISNLTDSEAAVFAQCIPPGVSGRTVNRWRAESGGRFRKRFHDLVRSSVRVKEFTESGALASELLENLIDSLREFCAVARNMDVMARRLADLSAFISEPLVQERIGQMAVKLGLKRRPFNAEVKRARSKANRTSVADDDTAEVINLSAQNAVWTGKVLKAVKNETFVVGEGQLGRLHGGWIKPFTASSFAAFVDAPGRCRFVRRNAQYQEAAVPFTKKDSELVLGSTIQHAEHTRPVDLVSTIPVLVLDDEDQTEVITDYSPGHHILVLDEAGIAPADVSNAGPTELRALIDLLSDFDFVDAGNVFRAVGMLLTPALARGSLLGKGRAPFFVITKDVHGAGGGFLCRVLCAIYGHAPTPLVPRTPDKLHESISRNLFEGRSILYLDNIRGDILSQLPFLESFLTEPTFDARRLYQHGQINVEHVMLMATSNGMTLSKDLADRTVEVGIRKRPPGYGYRKWTEGDIFRHIEANRAIYLTAIYGAIDSWVRAGRPSGETTGLRFTEWEAAVSWIAERIIPGTRFRLYPRGRTVREVAAERLSNPDFDVVTSICRQVYAAGCGGQSLTASEISKIGGELLDDYGDEPEKRARKLGSILKKFCRDDDQYKAAGDGFRIKMTIRNDASTNYRDMAQYTVLREE